MTGAVSLLLSVPPDLASAAVAATLSQQGFVVHRREGILHVERDPHPVEAGSSPSRASFRVRVDATADGSRVQFEATEGGAVMIATVRVARARLAEWGLTDDAEGLTDAAPSLSTAEAAASEVAGGTPASDDPDGRDGTSAGAGVARSGGLAVGSAASPGEPEGAVLAPPRATTPAGLSTTNGEGPYEPPAMGDRVATDGSPPAHALGMLAFVLGFIAPVGGIVAGTFALAILRRAPGRGRGLAIAGIVVGATLTILLGAAVIAGLSWLVVDAPASSTSASVASPAPSAAHSPAGAETQAPGFEAEVGQCFVQRGRGEIGEANLVDCATPHTYELYATFPAAAEADAYPGDAEVARQAEAGCVEAFSGFVGTAYDRSALDYVYLSPTRKTWLAGGRSVSCFVTDPEGTVTGTLRDAAR